MSKVFLRLLACVALCGFVVQDRWNVSDTVTQWDILVSKRFRLIVETVETAKQWDIVTFSCCYI